jgi:adenylate cyclase
MTLLPLGLMILLPPLASVLAGAGILLAYAAGVQYLFSGFQMVWPLVAPLGAGAATILALLIFNFMVEAREHRWIKKSFSQYLNKEVIDILVKHPDQLRLGGEEKDLTVIMADIRNFTTLSETLTPEALIQLLNRYLEELTEVILDNGGTLDKYMGDAVMAFFGAPVSDENHPQNACRTVIQMCDRLQRKRQEWMAQGLPALHFGVGISTGAMVVGNLGSRRRFDYSVIGDNVNLASRLEGLTKIYGVEVIIPEQTRDRLDPTFVCRELDMVQVKGRQALVRIFELIGMAPDQTQGVAFISQFERGLHRYRCREFEAAIRLFQQTLQLRPKDKPSHLFIQRCQQLMAEPPDDNWDGTWTFTTK